MLTGYARAISLALALAATLAGCAPSARQGGGAAPATDQSAATTPASGAPSPAAHPASPPATARAGEAWVNPKDRSELVYVPAGDFTMGSDTGDSRERPAHTAYLGPYWVGKTPVTVAQYRAFCTAVGRTMPAAPTWGWIDAHPIINLTWDDAKAYCEWAGLTLPTEAQWEKAARGTDGRVYPWGNAWDPARAVCSVSPANARSTEPVGSRPNGASPYGCLDMAGNVFQWCADWYDPGYAGKPNRNPAGPASGARRSLRGASWRLAGAANFHAAYRLNLGPADRLVNGGFRVASRPTAP